MKVGGSWFFFTFAIRLLVGNLGQLPSQLHPISLHGPCMDLRCLRRNVPGPAWGELQTEAQIYGQSASWTRARGRTLRRIQHELLDDVFKKVQRNLGRKSSVGSVSTPVIPSAGTFGLAGRGVAARKPCPAVHVPGPQVSSMVVVGKILYLAQTYKILEQLELKLFNLFHCEFVTHFPEFRVFKFMYLKRLQYFFALVTLGFYKLCFQGYLNKSTHAISLETGRFFSEIVQMILSFKAKLVLMDPPSRIVYCRCLDRLEVGVYGSEGFALRFGRAACVGSCASAGPSPLRLPCPGQIPVKGCDGSAPLIDSTGTTRYNTFHDGSDLDSNHPNPPHHSTLSELFAWATLCCDARCLTLQDPSVLTQLNELQLNRSPQHLPSTAGPGNRNPHRHYVYRYNMIQHNQ